MPYQRAIVHAAPFSKQLNLAPYESAESCMRKPLHEARSTRGQKGLLFESENHSAFEGRRRCARVLFDSPIQQSAQQHPGVVSLFV
jgi:hypothetical protein